MRILIVAIALLLGGAAAAGGGCLLQYGQPVCAPPSGTIVERYGRLVCGRGQCVEHLGRWVCAREPGGAVVMHLGAPRCVGGCEEAKESNCVAPR